MMRYLCPNCREPIDLEALTCAGGHRFACNNGVLSLLADSFSHELRAFLSSFEKLRAAGNQRVLDHTAYEQLPFIPAGIGDAQFQLEWRLRRHDLAIALDLLRDRSRQTILDIGAWNGWLSQQLAQRGHEVTAIDYFVDECDGLGARRFYRARWQAIQMDLTDLSVFDGCFDVIVVNRCLPFFSDPMAYVASLRQKLSAHGLLMITGLQFFQNPQRKAQRVLATQHAHHARYGFELFLRPTKGYLDFADKRALEALGVKLNPYPQLWRANLKSIVIHTSPQHRYGVWQAAVPRLIP